jgi:hypothetical protein
VAFTPTTWVDGTTAITAAQLNRIETGVNDAHASMAFGGVISGAGGVVTLNGPSGWSVTKQATGIHRITHNLGITDYSVVATVTAPASGDLLMVANYGILDGNYFDVHTLIGEVTGSSTVSIGLADVNFAFALVLIP